MKQKLFIGALIGLPVILFVYGICQVLGRL